MTLPLKTPTLLLLFLAVSALGAESDISDPTYLLELASVHLKHDSIQRAQPLIHKALELSKDPAQRDAAVQSL